MATSADAITVVENEDAEAVISFQVRPSRYVP